MHEILEPRAARGILRREIWRRSRGYLILVALLAGLGATALARGFAFGVAVEYDGLRAVDETFAWALVYLAFALALALRNREPALRSLLRHSPVDPAVRLRARLELGLAFGVLILGALLLSEYHTRPVLMHPSFTGRLNPAEAETLKRLPGVPLLRFTVDGRTTRGLTTELSLAALRSGGVGGYGATWRWSRHSLQPLPEPGEVLATLGREEWPQLDDLEKWGLGQLGIPAASTVEIVLERYVPEAEYLAQPWRRDGLFRERRWHHLDRAIGFLGLIVVFSCLLSAGERPGNPWQGVFLCMMIVQVVTFHFFGGLEQRLLFSDLRRAGFTMKPSIPMLGTYQTVAENLIWPLLVVSVCTAVYLFAARRIRRFDRGGTPRVETSGDAFQQRWRGSMLGSKLAPQPFELSAWRFRALGVGAAVMVTVTVLAFYGSRLDSGFLPWSRAREVGILTWVMAAYGAFVAASWMSTDWQRQVPLLRRLPAPPGEVVRQRLIRALRWLALFALVPLAVDSALALLDFSFRGAASGRGSILVDGTVWGQSLLVLVSGSLAMVLALLGRSMIVLKGLLIVVLCACAFLGLRGQPLPNLAVVLCLGVLAAALPVIHFLMRQDLAPDGVASHSYSRSP